MSKYDKNNVYVVTNKSLRNSAKLLYIDLTFCITPIKLIMRHFVLIRTLNTRCKSKRKFSLKFV